MRDEHKIFREIEESAILMKDPQNFSDLVSPSSFTSKQISLTKHILKSQEPIYAYGYSPATAALMDSSYAAQIKGWFQDEVGQDRAIDLPKTGSILPEIHIRDIQEGSIILSCVVEGRPRTALTQLDLLNVRFLDVFAFSSIVETITGEVITPHPFLSGARQYFRESLDALGHLYTDLDDDLSREVLLQLIKFRLGGNLRDFIFEWRYDEMYFEEFLCLDQLHEIVFLDIGAYKGENSLDLIQKFGKKCTCYLFEPSEVICQTSFPGYNKQVTAFRKAVGSSSRNRTILEVNHTTPTRSYSHSRAGENRFNIHNQALTSVDTVSIDEFCNQIGIVPTLIKVDTEGFELEVLNGAISTIGLTKPILAISVYHHPTHLLTAYRLLRNANKSYRFRLRHYTEGISETVLYAF